MWEAAAECPHPKRSLDGEQPPLDTPKKILNEPGLTAFLPIGEKRPRDQIFLSLAPIKAQRPEESIGKVQRGVFGTWKDLEQCRKPCRRSENNGTAGPAVPTFSFGAGARFFSVRIRRKMGRVPSPRT